MKLRLALLAVPFLALACSDTGQPDALTNPPAPSFADQGFPVHLANGCDVTAGVTMRKGGREIVGTDGDDAINCHLYNGNKGVTVKAGKGNDLIVGSQRDDHLSGGQGCDHIEGNAGNDFVDGGPGNDSPLAAGGCDDVPDFDTNGNPVTIDGGLFGDTGVPPAGDDHVKGGPGNDFLDGGPGTDVCEGGPGVDVLVFCA